MKIKKETKQQKKTKRKKANLDIKVVEDVVKFVEKKFSPSLNY